MTDLSERHERRDGGLYPRPSVRPAPSAAAGAAAVRTRRQARLRLSELDPQPPPLSPARRGRRADVRPAGAGAGSHRGHRRPRQSGAGGRVCAGAGLARRASDRRNGSPSFPAITMPMFARHSHRFRRGVGKLSCRRRCAGRWRDLSVVAPARPAGADRRLLSGADGAVDGDGMARQKPNGSARSSARCASPPSARFASCWFIIRSAPSARAKRLTDSPELLALLKQHGVELVLHGHDHVHSTMWVEGPNGSSIPAVGVPSASARRPWPLSRRGLQPVFDRARWRWLALPADGARHQRSASGAGNTTRAVDVERFRKNASEQKSRATTRLSPVRGCSGSQTAQRPNSASAPRRKPSANGQNRLRRGSSTTDRSRHGHGRSHQRMFALHHAARDIVGDGIDDHRHVVRLRDHDSAEAGVLHKTIRHACRGPSERARPRRSRAAASRPG